MNVGHHYAGCLHATIVYWFFSNRDYKDIALTISNVAANNSFFDIKSLEREDFGVDESLEVYLLKKSKELTKLHMELLDSLKHVEFENVRYQRDGWRPHVTTQGEKSFPIGSSHTVKNIYLIEALNADKDSDKIVRAKVGLKTGEIQT